MNKLRLMFTFYKSFIIASGIITIACLNNLYLYGLRTLTAILIFKLMTLVLIILFINLYKKNEFYYYHNLGLSKLKLWLSTLGIDMALFVVLIVIIQFVK